ncbi:hypothetical protein Tco_0970524 [Tanacetum coccineum]
MQVMAISIISVSLYLSKDSVGTPVGRVILFGTILDTTPFVTSPTTHIDTTPIPIVSPTIPPSPDYTLVSPNYSLAPDIEFDPSEDPSSDHIPPLPATLPFLSSTDDSSDSDIPDTSPSPTHGIPFTETTLSTQSIHVASGALRCRRVGPLPTHRLAMRRSVDYSSSDHFSLDDSSRDSSSSSSSDSFADSLFDSASSRSSFDHSSPIPSSGMRPSHHLCSLVPSIHRSSTAISKRPAHDSSFVSPSRKRSRSPTVSVSLSSPTLGALSCARADLLPPPKRIRSLETTTDFRGCWMDVEVVRSDGIDIDPEIQAEIDECFAYTDALIDREIDARGGS